MSSLQITFIFHMDRDVTIGGEGQRNLGYYTRYRCYWHLRRAGVAVSTVLSEVLSQFSDHLPQTREIRSFKHLNINVCL